MGHRIRGKSRTFPSLITAIWSLFVPAMAQEIPDLFLLDVEADGYVLAESLPAYASDDIYLIEILLEYHYDLDLWHEFIPRSKQYAGSIPESIIEPRT